MMKTISRVKNVFLRQRRAVGWTGELSDLKRPQGGYRIRFPKFPCILHTLVLRDGGEGKELRRIKVIASQCSHGGGGLRWALSMGGFLEDKHRNPVTP